MLLRLNQMRRFGKGVAEHSLVNDACRRSLYRLAMSALPSKQQAKKDLSIADSVSFFLS